MAKEKGPGIQSAAGLIRYYDADETNNIKIAPVLVMVFAGFTAAVTIFMAIFWKL